MLVANVLDDIQILIDIFFDLQQISHLAAQIEEKEKY